MPTEAANEAEKQLAQPLRVLDGALALSANLLGPNFTVADLNVASILAWARPAQIDMTPFPKTAEWLKNCAERRRHAPPGNCSENSREPIALICTPRASRLRDSGCRRPRRSGSHSKSDRHRPE